MFENQEILPRISFFEVSYVRQHKLLLRSIIENPQLNAPHKRSLLLSLSFVCFSRPCRTGLLDGHNPALKRRAIFVLSQLGRIQTCSCAESAL